MPVSLVLHIDAQVSSVAYSQENLIKVNFQNPVDGDLDLYVESDVEQMLKAELWSINGKKINDIEMGKSKYFHSIFPMQNLSKGMYLLIIINSAGENIYSAKVLK